MTYEVNVLYAVKSTKLKLTRQDCRYIKRVLARYKTCFLNYLQTNENLFKAASAANVGLTCMMRKTMKNNQHKKYTKEDKFARKHYCDNSRLAQLRSEKKAQRKKFRKEGKKMCEDTEEQDVYECAHNMCNMCTVYGQACPFNEHDCVDCEMFEEFEDYSK